MSVPSRPMPSIPMQSNLSCDNQGTIDFSSTPTMTMTRMKHITRDLYKIREWIADKLVKMGFVSSKKNPADLLTKGLAPTHFDKLRSMIVQRARA